MRFTASAPGKLLLLGDHAVVYGHPCLVTAVDIRYRVTVEIIPGDLVEIITPELRARGAARRLPAADTGVAPLRETAFVEAAVAQMFRQYNAYTGLRIQTGGQPLSYGLGSSSAVTAAAVGALNALFALNLPLEEQFRLAYAAVLDVQGKGSGFDVAAAVFGGTLYYVRGGERLEALPVHDLPFVIGYSGAKVGTVNLVTMVEALYQRQPAIVGGMFDLLHQIVDAGKAALLAGDWQAFGDLANLNHGILDSLGVNTLSLSRLIEAARAAGAYGAKLSGAGGGDCMFAIADERAAVGAAITAAGGVVVPFVLNAPGICLEPDHEDEP